MESNIVVSKEIYWLALTILLTSLIWVPYVVNRIIEMGLITALSESDADLTPKKKWANRLMKAHGNSVENLILFAPLVIIIDYLGINSEKTAMACAVFFWSRLAYIFVYTIAVPYLRTALFCVGFTVQICLMITLLKHAG